MKQSNNIKLVLASNSPRRQQILKQVGIKFIVDPAAIDEDLTLDLPPRKLVEYLSKQKALEVAKRHKNKIILAADTIVVCNNEIIGKPKNKADAKRILKLLSGKVHQVITGYTIIKPKTNEISPSLRSIEMTESKDVISTLSEVEGERSQFQIITNSVISKVYFKTLTDQEIDDYIATGEPMDKAGAYGIQGRGALLIKKISGDYFNIVGLPISEIYDHLK